VLKHGEVGRAADSEVVDEEEALCPDIERCSFMIRRVDVGGCGVVGRSAVIGGRKETEGR
jgi:hypothetical protein